MHGRSQAVRLSKAYRFEEKEVTIQHFAGGVLLLPKIKIFGSAIHPRLHLKKFFLCFHKH